MAQPNWKITAGLIIVIAAAIWWMATGIIQFLFSEGPLMSLAWGGLVGGIVLLTGLIAYRWRYVGGWILVFEGILPIFLALSGGNMHPLTILVQAGPPILAGILFLLD